MILPACILQPAQQQPLGRGPCGPAARWIIAELHSQSRLPSKVYFTPVTAIACRTSVQLPVLLLNPDPVVFKPAVLCLHPPASTSAALGRWPLRFCCEDLTFAVTEQTSHTHQASLCFIPYPFKSLHAVPYCHCRTPLIEPEPDPAAFCPPPLLCMCACLSPQVRGGG